MEVEKILHMKGGVGQSSYANNSLRTIMPKAKAVLEESIRDLYEALKPERFMMADMGCGSGPNAFSVASQVMDVINKACRSSNRQIVEIGVFLNDLQGNYFNTLFQFLTAFYKQMEQDNRSNFEHCFVSATPKSFYGRVFPTEFLHFVHSSLGLHWLSKGVIEEEKLDRFNIPCYLPTIKEVRQLVEAEGSFDLNRLESFTVDWSNDATQKLQDRANFIVNNIRSVTEPLITSEFGEAIVDDLFLRFRQKVVEHYLVKKIGQYFTILVSLTRSKTLIIYD